MSSFPRVALYILFDAIERDLISSIRQACISSELILTPEEKESAASALQKRGGFIPEDNFILLQGLHIGEKYAVLLRHKKNLDAAALDYFTSKRASFDRAIPIRNAVMHGRPLTTDQYAVGFALANEFLTAPNYWPELSAAYKAYTNDPAKVIATAITIVEQNNVPQVLHNLPPPDYDDTGFLPRPDLEKELRKKIFSRHPVVTVLGDGGNGKTALTLQTVYGLIDSNDHNFDAIVWVSAKSSKLTAAEIMRVEGAINTSLGLFEEVADLFEPGDKEPMDRVKNLLASNKVLLIIDNLETVLDDVIKDFASDVPGESKVIFTSRVPVGGDLCITVDGFSEIDALSYLRRVCEAYDERSLKAVQNDVLLKYLKKLGFKPLLIKWFVLGLKSGLTPEKILSKPDVALRFCMENVFEKLSADAKKVLSTMACLPSSLSLSVLENISDIKIETIEKAIAELLRFSIIESVSSSDYERLYQIKPFTRFYLNNIVSADDGNNEESKEIIRRYKKIEGQFQAERGHVARNKYDRRFYTVRSRSEALALKKLREACRAAISNKFDIANDKIRDLKVSNPAYFEVYRDEAFIAYRQGDIPRAMRSYETALELAPNQSQLHYFYAGFLIRTSGDYPLASKHFDEALKLDKESLVVLREAARCKLYEYQFDDAQNLIDRANENELKSVKDLIILYDLQIQLFIREASSLHTGGNTPGAFASLGKLSNFLCKIDERICDSTMIDHLEEALPVIRAIKNLNIYDENILLSLVEKIASISSRKREDTLFETSSPVVFGSLKLEGRKETYGFLRDVKGVDTFISRDSVPLALWDAMCNGADVTYQVKTASETGKKSAANVNLFIHKGSK